MMARRFGTIHACVSADEGARRKIIELVGRAGREIVHLGETALAARLGEVEVLLCGFAPRIDWSGARQLRLLQLTGSGTDSLWPATGLPAEVQVANTRGMHLPEMRDHALAMILLFERRLRELLDQQRRKEWRTAPLGSVSGKTVAILGLGVVGRGIAEACAALGMRVIGLRAEARPTPHVEEVYAEQDLERVLVQADYLVVTLPLTARTRGLVGRDALARLRPTAALVHMSRGGIVDELALCELLRTGKLRGAALDVFTEEPLPAASPLWTVPNLVVTPHVAGLVHDYFERSVAILLENIELLEKGLPPHTRVDRAREY